MGKWLDHEGSDFVQVLIVDDFTVCQAVGGDLAEESKALGTLYGGSSSSALLPDGHKVSSFAHSALLLRGLPIHPQ